MQNIFTVALPLLASVTTTTASLPQVFPPPPVSGPPPFSIIREEPTLKTAIREVAPEKTKEKRLICKGCNENENVTLAYFQDIGIKDKNALATILGNIRQESTFVPNICEGGSRTSYHNCWRGYGLIQWTSANRYYGLGDFARKIGGSPSTLDTQLRYLTNEVQWKEIEDKMKIPGKSINRYMDYAYSWIGWGHHGARTSYAHDYASRLITVEV
jgi:Phage tail lysozyme